MARACLPIVLNQTRKVDVMEVTSTTDGKTVYGVVCWRGMASYLVLARRRSRVLCEHYQMCVVLGSLTVCRGGGFTSQAEFGWGLAGVCAHQSEVCWGLAAFVRRVCHSQITALMLSECSGLVHFRELQDASWLRSHRYWYAGYTALTELWGHESCRATLSFLGG